MAFVSSVPNNTQNRPCRFHPAVKRFLCLSLSAFAFYWSAYTITHADPEFQQRLPRWNQSAQTQQIAPGKSLPAVLSEYQNQKVFLVLSPSCLGCNKKIIVYAMRLHRLLQPKGYAVILVPQNQAEELAPYRTGTNPLLDFPLHPDPNAEVSRALGVRDLPQVAEFEAGKVIWSKPPQLSYLNAVIERLNLLGMSSDVAQLTADLGKDLEKLKLATDVDACPAGQTAK